LSSGIVGSSADASPRLAMIRIVAATIGRRPAGGGAIGEQLAAQAERVWNTDLGAAAQCAHRANRLVVPDVRREIGGVGERPDRTDLTPGDQRLDASLGRPGGGGDFAG
jgi:hypothetical protein